MSFQTGTDNRASVAAIAEPAAGAGSSRGWVPELDHLRTLAILAVLAIHTTSGMTQVVPLNWVALVNLALFASVQFAVPLFILVSGLALARNHAGRFELLPFYRNRIRGIVPQYLLFSVLYIAFNAWWFKQPVTPRGLVLDLVFGDASFQLRFLPFLMQFYILFPLLMGAYLAFERRGQAKAFVVGSLVFQLGWNALVYWLDARISNPVLEEAVNAICLSSVFYFCLGIHAARDLDAIRRRAAMTRTKVLAIIVTLVLSGVVAAFYVAGIDHYGYYYYIAPRFLIVPSLLQAFQITAEFVLCLWVASVLLRHQGRLAAISRSIGNLAFGIYLVHVFFYSILIRTLPGLGLNYSQALWYPLLFAGMLGLSILVLKIVTPLPNSDLLFGVRPRSSRPT